MPIYEYRCQKCGHQLEAFQKVSDALLVECPDCKAPELRKMVSAAAFRLKGGGWYETDFKSGEQKKNLHGEPGKEKAGETKTGDSAACAGCPNSGSSGSEKTA